MATGNTGSGRGTVKKGGKYRTPKLSDAQKRKNKLNRSFVPKNSKTTVSKKGDDVPF